MKPTLLLTLGRLPKALDIARAFAAAGWRVIVAEPFRWHLAATSRAVDRSFQVTPPNHDQAAYLRDLAGIIRREHVDLVIPVSEETMHVAHLRGHIPAKVNLFTMPAPLVVALHDKHAFIEQAQAMGLDVPETAWLGDPAGASLAASGDVVVKPIFSCSGRGVHIVPNGTPLPQSDEAATAIVQRFVAGRVLSTCSIAHRGRVVATIIYGGGIMSGTVAVSFKRVPHHPSIEAWIARFVAKTDYTGFISFDFVADGEDRAWAIECNPRATSGLHFLNPQDLVTAIVDPDKLIAPRMRPEQHLQQFYASLTETQGSIRDRKRFAANLRQLATARDVTWRWSDPLPFLTMPLTSWKIISMSIARQCTFGEIATLDIGYYGRSN